MNAFGLFFFYYTLYNRSSFIDVRIPVHIVNAVNYIHSFHSLISCLINWSQNSFSFFIIQLEQIYSFDMRIVSILYEHKMMSLIFFSFFLFMSVTRSTHSRVQLGSNQRHMKSLTSENNNMLLYECLVHQFIS